MKDLSVYIHIPFCNSKCYYCSFISCVSEEKEKYFLALEKEIEEFENKDKYCIRTIYIGGGTPSSVDCIFIERTLQQLRNKFTIDKNAEITIECNPNSTNLDKLIKFKKAGINRISFGVQTFNKKSLKFIGRVQNNTKELNTYKKVVLNVLKQTKKLNFNSISVDIMLGLPYQSNRQIKKTIKLLSKYVDHFSTYMLSVEEGTKLFDLRPQGIEEEKVSKQYEPTVKFLKKAGFERYEISNFAKPKKESAHNNVYWSMGEYVGFGVAAHSFINKKRVANTEKISEYIDYYMSKKSQKDIKYIENISKEELAEETIMLALRTSKGLDLVSFRNQFYDLEKNKANTLALLLNNGFIKFTNNFLHLSNKGFLVSNAIILEIVE